MPSRLVEWRHPLVLITVVSRGGPGRRLPYTSRASGPGLPCIDTRASRIAPQMLRATRLPTLCTTQKDKRANVMHDLFTQ
jgi:hypothetical protein